MLWLSLMRSVRRWAIAFVLGVLPMAAPCPEAQASVGIAIPFDALVARSTAAAVVTGFEQKAVWEDDHIYTYTHVRVDTAVAGSLKTGDEAWVRTMGGVVGRIGQVVDGEAVMILGRPSLLFVHEGTAGVLDVTARAQGQFAVVVDAQSHHMLARSSAVGALVAPHPGSGGVPTGATPGPLASDVIHGHPLDSAARDIAAAWVRLHAH
jgi:hypothetical protein